MRRRRCVVGVQPRLVRALRLERVPPRDRRRHPAASRRGSPPSPTCCAVPPWRSTPCWRFRGRTFPRPPSADRSADARPRESGAVPALSDGGPRRWPHRGRRWLDVRPPGTAAGAAHGAASASLVGPWRSPSSPPACCGRRSRTSCATVTRRGSSWSSWSCLLGGPHHRRPRTDRPRPAVAAQPDQRADRSHLRRQRRRRRPSGGGDHRRIRASRRTPRCCWPAAVPSGSPTSSRSPCGTGTSTGVARRPAPPAPALALL